MATLDLHLEAPPALVRREEQARFEFNKTIAGHYRNGPNYSKVGALFLTWEGDDMDCKSKEVDRLQTIFQERFNYTTDVFAIPSERSETGLQKKIADFAHEYNQPNNLMILYYAGHAYTGLETQALKLAAREAGDSDGDPRAFFNDILNTLRLPDTDILVIIDCCFAAKAFAHGEMGKRKFELLASAPPEERALSPKHEGSFTKILADILDGLLDHPQDGNGFSTSKLYREVYHNAKLRIKPYLFDQSRYDYGKIWLRPLPATSQAVSGPNQKDITIDLTLHLTGPPDGLMMNDLAKYLQYLPHVEKVDLTRLHAPEKDIKSLIFSMKRLHYIVRWIRKARTRLREKEALNLQRQGAAYRRGQSFFALLEKQHNTSLYNWSNAVALLKNGTSIPVREPTNPRARRDLNQTSQFKTEQAPGFKVHYFLGLFSVAYSLDLRSTKALMTGLFSTPNTGERRTSVHATGHQHPGPPHGHIMDESNHGMPLPSMVSVVEQAREQHISRTTPWDVFTWAMIVMGLVCLCHVTRE